MHKCDICHRKDADTYPVDGHLVCDECLTRGRLAEMPEFAAEEDEVDLVLGGGATVSSWWNRQIPETTAR